MQKSSVKLCSFFSIALNSTCTAIDTWSLVPLFHTTCVTSYIIVFYGNRNCNQIVCERFKCGKAAATIKKTPSYGSNWCNNNNNKLDGLDRVGEHHMNGATVAVTIITVTMITRIQHLCLWTNVKNTPMIRLIILMVSDASGIISNEEIGLESNRIEWLLYSTFSFRLE